MHEPQDELNRKRFLLTNLGILSAFILTLVVLLAAYPSLLAPPPTASATATLTPSVTPTFTQTPTITLTPTASRTPRPTFTPTITLTPSRTPTPTLTPTPTGPPTLTPAVPVAGNEDYELQTWSPEQAQQLIDLMQDYPNTLPRPARGENDENYYAAFHFARIALSEALLRFPEAPQAEAWGWALAYNLARLGDSDAGGQYAELITQALNAGQVTPAGLEDWFQAREPRLTLEVDPLSAVPGYLSAHLLRIQGQGGAQILLLETHGAFQTHVLSSDFDFTFQPRAVSRPASELAGAPESQSFSSDLTGDGVAELVIYPSNPGETFTLNRPRILDLTHAPPKELVFNPALSPFEVGIDYINQWSAASNGGEPVLQFETTVFPACPVQIRWTYRWTGQWFDLVESKFQVQPSTDTLAFCQLVVDHAAAIWGPDATIQLMEAILPHWPPAADAAGDPLPPDAADEWRYRLGVAHALNDDYEKAIRYLTGVVANPAAPGSQWVGPAQAFLERYDSPADIYRACVEAQFCDPRQALRVLVRKLPRAAYSEALTSLWQSGVALRASGYFDFDGDGSTESWFTVRHRPGERLDLWILAAARDTIEPLFVGVVESSKPVLTYAEQEQEPPVVLVDSSAALSLHRLPDSLQPYLTYPERIRIFPNRFQEGLAQARSALFSGVDPAIVRNSLLDLQENPGLLCRGTWSCDEYYYLLGLSAELAGDDQAAVEPYLRLWLDYSKSPYTTMARLKLEGEAALPTTPTITPVPSVTLAPTITGTPPTATSTLAVTATPGTNQTATPTMAPTVTPGTPYP